MTSNFSVVMSVLSSIINEKVAALSDKIFYIILFISILYFLYRLITAFQMTAPLRRKLTEQI